jgi:tetratricopeptide (TPR) repeat protein
VSTEELRNLARRMASGPKDPTFYERALDAAAVTRRGLELLEELAEEIEGHGPRIRAAADPAQLAAFRPGDRMADPDGEEARTDLSDLAAAQIRLSLGAGSAEDLQELLAALTDTGLKGQLIAVLSEFLEQLPEDTIERLRQVATRWPKLEEASSAVRHVAEAMLPHPEGRQGDLLAFAAGRLREALSLIRTGKEMLGEVAALLPQDEGRAVDPEHFKPGAVVRLSDDVVPTDPLRLLGSELTAILASAPQDLEELEYSLQRLVSGLDHDGRPVGILERYLTPGVLLELATALGVPVTESAPLAALEPTAKRRMQVNLGQLTRSLARAPRWLASIDAAWKVLASDRQPFAARFAAGVHLCRQTRELARDKPKEAAAWAAQVVKVAEGLAAETDGFPARMATFLATFATAHIGNALRVEGHLRAAERFFLPWDEDDLMGLRAEYLGLKSALRLGERQYREALSLLEEADKIARRGEFPGALDTAARIRVTEARILIMLGELDAAASFLRSALGTPAPIISGRSVIPAGKLSPAVRWNVLQNLADCLSKAGALDEAASVLPEVEELGLAIGLPETEQLRIAWIRARVRLPEDWADALETLRAVRSRFIELGFLFDAALASLELAAWHAEELVERVELPDEAVGADHIRAIRELASESARFFVGADVTPEAIAAIALFQYVSSVATPEPAVIRKIEQLLRQAVSW